MRQKTYLSFKDLRVFYDKDANKLRLTSGDSRLASQRWSLTLSRNTRDKAVLEKELVAAGLMPQHLMQPPVGERVLAGSAAIGNRIVVDANGFERGSLGPYIGRTSDGADEAVFYSPLADLREDMLPLCMLTGAPGSGKSFAALRIVDGMLQQGATVAMLDPKGDFVRYAERWGGGHTRQLRDQPPGLLNPFELEGEGRAVEAAMATLTTLFGGAAAISVKQQQVLQQAVVAASQKSKPSLSKVMRQLEDGDQEAQWLLDNLRLLREHSAADLIFRHGNGSKLELVSGPNLLEMRGLDLPPAQLPPRDYSNGNRLAAAIYSLAHLHLRQALNRLPREVPAVLVAEEAWLLTTGGAELHQLHRAFSQSRSRRQATILISQDAADFSQLDAPATRMFFRQRHDSGLVPYLTGGTVEPEWSDEVRVRALVSSLGNGECVMEDGYRRRATVQISAGSEHLREAFSTNPATRGQTRRG